MSVDAIQITYLPLGITEEEIIQEMQDYLPPGLDIGNSLRVQIYQDGPSTSAVVTGFSCHYEKLVLGFRHLTFYSAAKDRACTSVNIKPDTGEIRNHIGKFIVQRPPSFRRSFEKLAGVTPRKGISFLSNNMLEQIKEIFRGFQTALYIPGLLPEDLKESELKLPGFICTLKSYQTDKGTVLRYGSETETLQAILYLHKNSDAVMIEKDLVFGNLTTDKPVSLSFQKGLGKDGECIDLEGIVEKEGFIPLQILDDNLVDMEYVDKVQNSVTCWTCEEIYKIKGVTLFLNSFAACCGCPYTKLDQRADIKGPEDLQVENPRPVAISWECEQFTRIISAKATPPDQMDLDPQFCVQYQPVKRIYSSIEEYEAICGPLLYEEWKTISTTFKEKNQTFGRVVLVRLVDEEKQGPGGKKTYALKINVNRSAKVWCEKNPSCVSKVTLEYRLTQGGRVMNKWKKLKLFKITSAKTGVNLHCRVHLNGQLPPENNSTVSVIPKPSKSEYKGLKQALRKWKRDDEYNLSLTTIMLNPLQPPSYWLLNNEKVPRKPDHYLYYRDLKRWVDNVCNKEQLSALYNAIKNTISFIHGPPGTGKTYLLSVIVNYLCESQEGNILVTAPSNFAVDGIAKAILKNHRPGQTPPRVLRVFANSKEEYGVEPAADMDPCFGILHNEVQGLEEWLNADNCEEFATHARSNKLILLTEEQFAKYKLHKSMCEKTVMSKNDVFVATISALADKRIESFASKKKIKTIVVDEAGQLQHVSTLHLRGINAPRIIFAGDPEQLPPTIESQAAQYAGFDMSLMETVYSCGAIEDSFRANFPPWTRLLEQHRMHPTIRELVSKLTYMNDLRDAASCEGNEPQIIKPLDETYHSRIVVLNHKSNEIPIGVSRRNEYEASMIVNEISKLVRMGVPPCEITVLTLYEAQRVYIRQLLSASVTDVSVVNVDAFQGRESTIIFLSLTRSNRGKEIGFAASQNRINVALSRAQQYLFIGCNLEFFGKVKIKFWVDFCNLVKKLGQIVDRPE